MFIMETKSSKGIEILFVSVSHGCEELNRAICVIQNKGINRGVPILLIRMIQVNIRLPCLKGVILVPDVEHLST
jgi:hypothetical protein